MGDFSVVCRTTAAPESFAFVTLSSGKRRIAAWTATDDECP
jgi:hypothetical protein